MEKGMKIGRLIGILFQSIRFRRLLN